MIDYFNNKHILSFYEGKRVFITGNTGFKGSWLTYILLSAGAVVTGYSLQSPTDPNLFTILELDKYEGLKQYYSDVRDLEVLKSAFQSSKPEIVFHLAAQPIVRDSYRDPVNTYATNVMGTVNVCECVRLTPSVRSFLNVTTDKVYRNNEWAWGYRETDELDGFDPYSNSKSCSELVTHSYRDSFFQDCDISVSTARAGNVVGGGDFSNDRIIPDCVRALADAKERRIVGSERDAEAIINVRNHYSTRPYEHVLEPLFAYIMIAKAQYEDEKYAGYYNVGPDDMDCVSTGNLVTLFSNTWNEVCGSPRCSWVNKVEKDAPHEAGFLKLDCSKLKVTFDWNPTWHIDKAIANVIAWTKVWMDGGNIKEEMDREIEEFIVDSWKSADGIE